jgi:hypothetical protein
MARWNDLLSSLGGDGARKNAARAVEDRRRAEAELDQFLARFAHPAGSAGIPTERRQVA